MANKNTMDTARPEALHTVSDAEKAAAIAAACKAVSGHILVVRIEMVDYNGRLGSRGPFGVYSEIRFSLFADGDDDSINDVAESLQQVADDRLSEALATTLGKLTGESYRAHIALKRIRLHQKRGVEIGQFRLQLTRA